MKMMMNLFIGGGGKKMIEVQDRHLCANVCVPYCAVLYCQRGNWRGGLSISVKSVINAVFLCALHPSLFSPRPPHKNRGTSITRPEPCFSSQIPAAWVVIELPTSGRATTGLIKQGAIKCGACDGRKKSNSRRGKKEEKRRLQGDRKDIATCSLGDIYVTHQTIGLTAKCCPHGPSTYIFGVS